MAAGAIGERHIELRSPLCVHLLPSTEDAGAEKQALYLLEALRDAGVVQVELAYFAEGRAHREFEALGISMRRIGRDRRLAFDLRRRVRALRGLYGADPPAILHAWLTEAMLVGLAAARSWRDARVVVAHQTIRIEEELPGAAALVLRRLIKRADHAIANSRAGLASLRGLLPATKVSLIDNGVPPARVRPARSPAEVRRALGVAPSTPLAVAVGRPDATKDFPTLVAAMERVRATLKEATLVLVGVAPSDFDRLGICISEATLPVGWQSNPVDFMQAADVVVISSLIEGHSNVADEALLLGRPVASTDVGAHPAIVAETGGAVVPVSRPDLLADSILSLLGNPPDPARVRAVAATRLAMAPVVSDVVAVYERLLQTKLTGKPPAVSDPKLQECPATEPTA